MEREYIGIDLYKAPTWAFVDRSRFMKGFRLPPSRGALRRTAAALAEAGQAEVARRR